MKQGMNIRLKTIKSYHQTSTSSKRKEKITDRVAVPINPYYNKNSQ